MSAGTYIGIDPGKSGGIAWLSPSGQAYARKLPDTMRDLIDLLTELRALADYRGLGCSAYLERVRSSPQMGVVSAFTFGRGFGHIEMALTAAKIRYDEVRPQEWQKRLNCLSKGDKNVTKARAQGLFPHLKITHATADALLIAEYGRRKMEGIK